MNLFQLFGVILLSGDVYVSGYGFSGLLPVLAMFVLEWYASLTILTFSEFCSSSTFCI